MKMPPSVSTPSTSSRRSLIFLALFRTLSGIRFTGGLNDAGLEKVVNVKDPDWDQIAGSLDDKQRGDRTWHVLFHSCEGLRSKGVFLDRSRLKGHNLVRSPTQNTVTMRL